MKKTCWLIFALSTLAPLQLLGQSWSTFLDPTRAIDWSNAGFSIPNYTVACSTAVSLATGSGAAAANTTSIQNALASCDSTHNVVNIPAGTWYINGLTFNSQSKVVVRGASANTTHLMVMSTIGCNGFTFGVCMGADTGVYWQNSAVLAGGTNQCLWSAGYTQGTTSVTLSSCGSTPPASGVLLLDQANDTSDGGGVFICDAATSGTFCSNVGSGNANGRIISGKTHSQIQSVFATIVSAGGGNFTATLDKGVYFNNVRSGQAPGAWWTGDSTNVGIENLTYDQSLSGGDTGIALFNCYQCWVKGVRSLFGGRNHIAVYESPNAVIRDNYFYSSQTPGTTQSYGIEVDHGTSRLLVENNIFQQLTVAIMNGQGSGNVFGYNYSVDILQGGANMGAAGYYDHNAGNEMNLWEGNMLNEINVDSSTFGPSDNGTFYRNNLLGWQSGKSQYTYPVSVESASRAYNVIGNVLGQPGYQVTYESYATSSSGGVNGGNAVNTSIYALGWTGISGWGGCGGPPTAGCDPLARSTLMRWANYDTVNATNRYDNTEASPAAVPYVNANFSSSYFLSLGHSLPASLYYSTTPSWWPGSKVWPPIGPDVTTGNVGICTGTYAGAQATSSGQCTGGTLSTAWASHVVSLPAQDCALSLGMPPDGTGSVLAFDATTCYATTPTAATPAFSPAAGSFSTPQYVSISSSTPGATVYFTVDGSTPTTSSAIYKVPLYVYSTQTLKALAVAAGYANSAIGSAAYTIAAQKTRFSLMRASTSQVPVPFPSDDRMLPSSGVKITNIESTRGTYTWTSYDAWVTSANAHGAKVQFTYTGRPNWMTGLGTSTDGPPTDLNTTAACQNVLTGTTTTDCSMKEFTTAHMMHITGLGSQPVAPVACPNLDELEAGNEVDTASGSSNGVGWSGTAAQFAEMSDDIAEIKAKWCTSATKMQLGSVSAVVGSNVGSNPQYEIYMAALLALIPQADQGLYQGVSFHAYPGRDNVIPVPPPSGLVSYSDPACTSGNTPNNSCRNSIATQVTTLQTGALNQAANVSWSKHFPVSSTEGGFNKILNLNGDNNFGIAYVSEYIPLLAAQAPVTVEMYLGQDPTSGTSAWGNYWKDSTGSISPWYVAFTQTTAWLNAASIGTCTTSSITGGTKWTCPLNGGTSEIDFCAVQNPATCTGPTSFTQQKDINGVITPISGTVTLNSTAVLLFNGAIPAPPSVSVFMVP